MAGPLNMSNNKITNLAKPTDDKDGLNKKYIDDNYLKLSGGTVTGHIILNNAILISQYQAISGNTGNAFFWYKLLIHMFTTNLIWSITGFTI